MQHPRLSIRSTSRLNDDPSLSRTAGTPAAQLSRRRAQRCPACSAAVAVTEETPQQARNDPLRPRARQPPGGAAPPSVSAAGVAPGAPLCRADDSAPQHVATLPRCRLNNAHTPTTYIANLPSFLVPTSHTPLPNHFGHLPSSRDLRLRLLYHALTLQPPTTNPHSLQHEVHCRHCFRYS